MAFQTRKCLNDLKRKNKLLDNDQDENEDESENNVNNESDLLTDQKISLVVEQ